jgi:hypothetical protein
MKNPVSDRQADREEYISKLEPFFHELKNSNFRDFNIEQFKQAILNGSWDFAIFDLEGSVESEGKVGSKSKSSHAAPE